MLRGIALAFLSYALFSWNDATIKALGGRLPVFEIIFFATLFTCITIAFLRPRRRALARHIPDEPSQAGSPAHALRIVAGLGGTYAFTTIPLAEAYALMFMAPAFVTLLSIFTPRRAGRLAAAHGGGDRLRRHAAGCEARLSRAPSRPSSPPRWSRWSGAISMIIMRMIGHTERRVSLVGVVMVGALVVSGVLMIPDFHSSRLQAELVRLGRLGVLRRHRPDSPCWRRPAGPRPTASRRPSTARSSGRWCSAPSSSPKFPDDLAFVGIVADRPVRAVHLPARRQGVAAGRDASILMRNRP